MGSLLSGDFGGFDGPLNGTSVMPFIDSVNSSVSHSASGTLFSKVLGGVDGFERESVVSMVSVNESSLFGNTSLSFRDALEDQGNIAAVIEQVAESSTQFALTTAQFVSSSINTLIASVTERILVDLNTAISNDETASEAPVRNVNADMQRPVINAFDVKFWVLVGVSAIVLLQILIFLTCCTFQKRIMRYRRRHAFVTDEPHELSEMGDPILTRREERENDVPAPKPGDVEANWDRSVRVYAV